MKKREGDSNNPKWMTAWSQQNQESYMLLLLNIALLVLVPRTFAMTVCDTYMVSYRMIKRALELNHIKEYTHTQKVNSRQHKITSYGITPAGLSFLTVNYKMLPKSYEWIKEVRVPTKARVKDVSFSSKYIERFLNINGSAFIASMAGIEINPINVDGGVKNGVIEESQSLNQIIVTTWDNSKYGKQDAEPKQLIYKNAYEIKTNSKKSLANKAASLRDDTQGSLNRHTKQP